MAAEKSSVDQPLRQIAVGIDAAVTEKRPVCARDIDFAEVDRHQKIFFFVHAGLGDDLARCARDETLSPELDAVAARGTLESDAVRAGNVATIRDAVAALDQFR